MMHYASHDIVSGSQDEPELQDIYHYYEIGDIVFAYSDRYSVFMNHYTKAEFRLEMQKMPESKFAYHGELFDYIFDVEGAIRNKDFD